MFFLTLSDGRTLVEGKNVTNFAEVPDVGITSAQLALPHITYQNIGLQKLKRNSTIAIGSYEYYYIAYQAVANMASFGTGQVENSGQGTITHHIMAGISDNEVMYIKLAVSTGNVTIENFNLDWWLNKYGISPLSFKKGITKR